MWAGILVSSRACWVAFAPESNGGFRTQLMWHRQRQLEGTLSEKTHHDQGGADESSSPPPGATQSRPMRFFQHGTSSSLAAVSSMLCKCKPGTVSRGVLALSSMTARLSARPDSAGRPEYCGPLVHHARERLSSSNSVASLARRPRKFFNEKGPLSMKLNTTAEVINFPTCTIDNHADRFTARLLVT